MCEDTDLVSQWNTPKRGCVSRWNQSIASATIPQIPIGGAAGYLVIGRTPGDALGLLPSSTVLPAGSDGIFHGTLVVNMNGPNIVLAQEYNGSAMLNLLVTH